jgi:multiple sugar transport system substrate-binding protein
LFRFRTSILSVSLLLAMLSTGVNAARPVVTIATYSQPRYQIMTELLLPKWQAQHPDIEIKVVNFPDFWNKLLVLIGTGDAPDIVDTAGTYLFGHVVRSGVVDLESIVMNDPDLNPKNFWAGPWNEVCWPQPAGSGVYGIPYDTVASVLWYNKSLFDTAGIAYPSLNWTWDDLRANAKKIARDTNGDGVNDIWGFTASTTHAIYDPLVKSFGGQVLSADRQKAAINSPQAAAATQFLADMLLQDRSSALGLNFANQNLGMVIIGSANISVYSKVSGLDWGVTTVPRGPVTHNTYGGSNLWEVMKRPNQDLDAVVTVLKELVTRETIEAFWASYDEPYSIPSSREVTSRIKLNDIQLVVAQSSEFMTDADWSPDWSIWQTAKNNAITPVLRGERSVQEGLMKAEQDINTVLENAYGIQSR